MIRFGFVWLDRPSGDPQESALHSATRRAGRPARKPRPAAGSGRLVEQKVYPGLITAAVHALQRDRGTLCVA